MSPNSIARPASIPRQPKRRLFCSTASSSARACCSSSAARASDRSSWRNRPRSYWIKQEAGAWPRPLCRLEASGGALQLLVAFAVIAAALLDPLHAAIAVGGLVGVVLVDAGVQAPLAGGLLGVFRINGVRIDRGAGRQGRRGSRGGLLLRLLRLGRDGGGGAGGAGGGRRP